MSFIQKIFASIFLLISIMATGAIASDNFPSPPNKIQHPYPDVAVTTLKSAQTLLKEFERYDYTLADLTQTHTLPAIYVETLPHDLNSLPVKQKTSGFIRLLLPTISDVNQHILAVRQALIAIETQPQTNWSEAERQWVDSLLKDYDVKSGKIEDLLLQVDIIPVGMALAQGIDESGWGTSHFAIEGSNLYGEHLSSRGGKYLTTPGGHVKVAAFDNLFAGTASYMHNLNTTDAYKDMWLLRKQLRNENNLTGRKLIQALSHYSTRGQAYVDNLAALIKHHNLDSFDHLQLESDKPTRIRLSN
ncbi:glucosaminidase domain-containing protein [Vibrio cionasavignyae]|uniref:glucosaminidase domain-containing protein n=1 Tax=Vibrio cionasavignyae TaxID=2910252 RepID=UPI003D104736